VQHVRGIEQLLAKLVESIQVKPRLGVHLREIQGKELTMATLPPVTCVSVERILISTAPLAADGTPDTAAVITWASSAPEQIGIEPLPEHDGLDAEGQPTTIPATHQAWATTPLDSGAADITMSSPGYETDVLPVSYVPGQRRRLNVSVGTPVPD
jgi:hypothetical protein